MAEFVRTMKAHRGLADIAEYAVMLFVTVMTAVSTLRLLGVLP